MTMQADVTSNRRTRSPLALIRSDSPGDTEIDWSSWELEDEDNHEETPEHFLIGEVLHRSIEMLQDRRLGVFSASEPRRATILRNTVFTWMEQHQKVRVCPDVYVLFDAPDPLPRSFMTWLPGHRAPDLALEVVSDEREKEYEVNPAKYASLGASELIIYDPRRYGTLWRGEDVAPLQRYRRQEDGLFERMETGALSVYCATLGVWLVSWPTGDSHRLRLSLDAHGEKLVPTREEAKAEERAEKERVQAELERLTERLRALGIDPNA